jgi:hypothetical protein
MLSHSNESEKIDEFIQEMRLKFEIFDDIKVE